MSSTEKGIKTPRLQCAKNNNNNDNNKTKQQQQQQTNKTNINNKQQTRKQQQQQHVHHKAYNSLAVSDRRLRYNKLRHCVLVSDFRALTCASTTALPHRITVSETSPDRAKQNQDTGQSRACQTAKPNRTKDTGCQPQWCQTKQNTTKDTGQFQGRHVYCSAVLVRRF